MFCSSKSSRALVATHHGITGVEALVFLDPWNELYSARREERSKESAKEL
jgi:hypothetical protein